MARARATTRPSLAAPDLGARGAGPHPAASPQADLRNEHFRAIYEATACGIAVQDGMGKIVDANAAAARILGLGLDELRGRALAQCHRGASRADGSSIPPHELPTQVSLRTARPERSRVFAITRLDGRRRWLQVETVPLVDAAGRVTQVVTSFIDITTLKLAEQALYHQATHDALTDLPNRNLLHDRLEHAILAARRGGTTLALLLMDLDRFKEVNDTLGHYYGDLLLQQAAARLKSALRASDTVARLGGDEFAALLPLSDETAAPWMAQKMLDALAAPFDVGGRRLEIGASIGIALFFGAAVQPSDARMSYPAAVEDAAALLRQADVAMYMAKRGGGGVAVYDAARDEHSPERLGLESELRQAIAQEQLALHYQPQVDVTTGRVYGVEALARWHHPARGDIPPAQFIGLAERTGLIAPLSRWVLDTALHQCRVWRRAGLDLDLAVNVSAQTLHDPQLLHTIAALLRRYGVNPSSLTLEITESVLMADLTRVVEVLAPLAKLGVRIAIDDFGTGYSSLGYLKRLPVDEIKIDKSFVTNIVVDDDDASILSFTIGLGRSLGLRVVAEGVEREETWSLLAALGCEAAQGFHIGRPMSAGAFGAWMAEARPSPLQPSPPNPLSLTAGEGGVATRVTPRPLRERGQR